MSWTDHINKMTFYQSNPDWVWYDEDEVPHLTEKAPPEAVESYEYAMEIMRKSEDTGVIYH